MTVMVMLSDTTLTTDNGRGGHHSFTRFLLSAILEAQHKIREFLNKYFETSTRANRQKQSYDYATEKWKDIKIALLNKLAKEKSHPQSQLSGELCKPMTDHKSYIAGLQI